MKLFSEKPKDLHKKIKSLKKKMKSHVESLEFEDAARIRDEIKRLEMLELKILGGDFIKEVQNR